MFLESCSTMAGSCCMAMTLRGISSRCCRVAKCHVLMRIRSSNVNSKIKRPSVTTCKGNTSNYSNNSLRIPKKSWDFIRKTLELIFLELSATFACGSKPPWSQSRVMVVYRKTIELEKNVWRIGKVDWGLIYNLTFVNMGFPCCATIKAWPQSRVMVVL